MPEKFASNTWAFALFLLAAGVAVTAATMHEPELMKFAGGLSVAAGVMFQGSAGKPS